MVNEVITAEFVPVIRFLVVLVHSGRASGITVLYIGGEKGYLIVCCFVVDHSCLRNCEGGC